MAMNKFEAEREAKEIVNGYALVAVSTGWIPHACLVLTPMQINMCHDIASCLFVEDYVVETVLGTVLASISGHLLADTVLTYIPILGWGVKTIVAGSVTTLLGEALINHFKECSPLPEYT
jgi:uncharacterized protein (DUF697 family)